MRCVGEREKEKKNEGRWSVGNAETELMGIGGVGLWLNGAMGGQ